MGVIIRQGIKGTLANYVGIGVGAFNMLYLFPKVLSEVEIGLIRTLLDIALVFASIFMLGGREIMTKFFSHFKEKKQDSFYWFSSLFPLIGFTLFSLLFYFNKDLLFVIYEANSPLLNDYIHYLLPLTFITLFSYYFETLSYLFGRITIPKVIREVYLRLFTGISVLFYFFDYFDLSTLIMSVVGIHALALIFFAFNAWKVSEWSFSTSTEIFNKKFSKQILNFMGFTIFGSLSGILVSKVDILMLSASKGLADTGIYSIAFFIAIVVETPKRSLGAISNPIIAESLQKGDHVHVELINRKSAINLLITSGFIFLLILSNLDNLFQFMPNGIVYSAGKDVIILIGFSKIIEAVSGMNFSIISYSHLYRYGTLILFLFSTIGISLNALLIPKLGMNGAAIATLITITIVHLFIHLLVYLKFGIATINKQIFQIIGILILTYLINMLLPIWSHFFIDGFVRTSILTIFFVSIIYYTKVSEEINQLLLTALETIKLYLVNITK